MIFIMLPMHNECESIPKLFDSIKIGMERRGFEYELVAYDDGSTDGTLEILKSYQPATPLRIIGKEQNKGLGFAFRSLINEVCSLSKSQDDFAICLDSDNTHNPEHIYSMVNKIYDGFDLVIASRFLKDSRVVGVPMYRNMLSHGASALMRLLFPIKGVKDYTCGYRCYRVETLKEAQEFYGDRLIEENGFACMAELLIKLQKLNILVVEIPLILRYDWKEGESKMDVLATVGRTFKMLMKFLLLKAK